MLSLCAFIILLVVAVFISANYVFTFILDTSEKNDLFKDVEPEEAQKFWPLYNELQQKLPDRYNGKCR